MYTASFRIIGIAPLSQSAFLHEPKLEKEQPDAYEKRVWQKRMHVTDSGQVYIPPMALKNCLSECAQFLSIQIPGKGKSTFTKHFLAGLLCTDPVLLFNGAAPVLASEVVGEWLMMNSDGVKGCGKRVPRCYPRIVHWQGDATIQVLDEMIMHEVLERHLEEAGSIIGMGRFRPRLGGYYGRFRHENFKTQAKVK